VSTQHAALLIRRVWIGILAARDAEI